MVSFLEQYQHLIDIVNISVGAVIFTITICGNTLTIIALLKFKYLHIKSNILIFSLSLCDICCVTAWLIMETINFTLKLCKMKPEYHVFLKMTTCIFFQSSAYHLVMISIERYITVFHGLRSEQMLNKKVFTLMLTFCWIFSTGVNMALAPWISYWNKENHTCDYAEIWRKVMFFMNLNVYLLWGNIMLFLYYRIYKLTKQQIKQIQSLQIGPVTRRRRVILKQLKHFPFFSQPFLYLGFFISSPES